MEQVHRSEYDGEFHQRVTLTRIFGEVEGEVDYTATLLTLREAVVARTWTDSLAPVLDSILWEEETPRGYANRVGIEAAGAITISRVGDPDNYPELSDTSADNQHHHAYRALQELVAQLGLNPIMKDADMAQDMPEQYGWTVPRVQGRQ